ncbi:MAG: hypothetical protein ACKO38_14690, partial [Planctomycetota bacterium]
MTLGPVRSISRTWIDDPVVADQGPVLPSRTVSVTHRGPFLSNPFAAVFCVVALGGRLAVRAALISALSFSAIGAASGQDAAKPNDISPVLRASFDEPSLGRFPDPQPWPARREAGPCPPMYPGFPASNQAARFERMS